MPIPADRGSLKFVDGIRCNSALPNSVTIREKNIRELKRVWFFAEWYVMNNFAHNDLLRCGAQGVTEKAATPRHTLIDVRPYWTRLPVVICLRPEF